MSKIVDISKETEEEKAFETDFDFENDKEFAALLNGVLSKEFDEEGISVSEDLIAKTMGRISQLEKEPEQTTSEQTVTPIPKKKNPMRFAKLAAGIAAACFIGVLGIAIIKNNWMSKGDVEKCMDSAAENYEESEKPVQASNDSKSASSKEKGDDGRKYTNSAKADVSYSVARQETQSEEACDTCESVAEAFSFDAAVGMEDENDFYSEDEVDWSSADSLGYDKCEIGSEAEEQSGETGKLFSHEVGDSVPMSDNESSAEINDGNFSGGDIENPVVSGYNTDDGEFSGIYNISNDQLVAILQALKNEFPDDGNCSAVLEMTEDEMNREIDENFRYGLVFEEEGWNTGAVFVYEDRIEVYSWPEDESEPDAEYMKLWFDLQVYPEIGPMVEEEIKEILTTY